MTLTHQDMVNIYWTAMLAFFSPFLVLAAIQAIFGLIACVAKLAIDSAKQFHEFTKH